jgi:hypothetical protein
MGRELKRVPMDFDHPLDEVWPGYLPQTDEEAEDETWEGTEPPEGEGYQLWETTTEGSPQSPVFATLDELCTYAAERCTTFASNKTSAAEWRRMLDDGFVCHEMVAGDGTRVMFI